MIKAFLKVLQTFPLSHFEAQHIRPSFDTVKKVFKILAKITGGLNTYIQNQPIFKRLK